MNEAIQIPNDGSRAPSGRSASADSLRDILDLAQEALERFASWRKQCHEYDEDMGYEKRDFNEESLEQIEQHATEILERFQEARSEAENVQAHTRAGAQDAAKTTDSLPKNEL